MLYTRSKWDYQQKYPDSKPLVRVASRRPLLTTSSSLISPNNIPPHHKNASTRFQHFCAEQALYRPILASLPSIISADHLQSMHAGVETDPLDIYSQMTTQQQHIAAIKQALYTIYTDYPMLFKYSSSSSASSSSSSPAVAVAVTQQEQQQEQQPNVDEPLSIVMQLHTSLRQLIEQHDTLERSFEKLEHDHKQQLDQIEHISHRIDEHDGTIHVSIQQAVSCIDSLIESVSHSQPQIVSLSKASSASSIYQETRAVHSILPTLCTIQQSMHDLTTQPSCSTTTGTMLDILLQFVLILCELRQSEQTEYNEIIKQLQQQLCVLHERIIELETQHEIDDYTIKKQAQKIQQMTQQIGRLEGCNESLTAQLDCYKTDSNTITTLNAQIYSLEQQLISNEMTIAEFEQKQKQLEVLNEELLADNTTLKMSNTVLLQSNTRHVQENNMLLERIETLDVDKATLIKEKTTLEQTIEQMTTKHYDYQQQIAGFNNVISILRQKIMTFSETQNDLKTQCLKAQFSNVTTKCALIALQRDYDTISTTMKTNSKQKDDEIEQYNALHTQYISQTTTIGLLTEEKLKLQQHLEQLKEELSTTQTSRDDLQNARRDADYRLQRVLDKLRDEVTKNTLLQHELGELRENVIQFKTWYEKRDNLTDLTKSLEQELSTANMQLVEVKLQRDELYSKLSCCEAKYGQLKERLIGLYQQQDHHVQRDDSMSHMMGDGNTAVHAIITPQKLQRQQTTIAAPSTAFALKNAQSFCSATPVTDTTTTQRSSLGTYGTAQILGQQSSSASNIATQAMSQSQKQGKQTTGRSAESTFFASIPKPLIKKR